MKQLAIALAFVTTTSLPVSAQNFQTKTVERLVAECKGSSTDKLYKAGCEGNIQSSRDIVMINCSGLSKFIDQVMSLGGDIEQQQNCRDRLRKIVIFSLVDART